MARGRTLLLGFLLGLTVAALAFTLARRARPQMVDAAETSEALFVALQAPVMDELRAGTRIVYVRSNYEWQLVPRLQHAYPAIQFRRGSERPPDTGCDSPDPAWVRLAPCARPDYIAADVMDSPLWRTMVIQTGVYNGGCRMALVKAFSQWRVVSSDCLVV